MSPKIIRANFKPEILTPEGCYITENHSDSQVSIARARVKPGVTTRAHHLKDGVQEIYIVTSGKGIVSVGNLPPTEVTIGDVVVIPPFVSQKISNTGKTDLVFYCICTPHFLNSCYVDEETEKI